MNCRIISDHIIKYFDGTLGEAENSTLEKHLSACRLCNDEFESMCESFDLIEKNGYVEPPENFKSMVMEKVNTMEEKRKNINSIALTVLYNTSALVSIAFILTFVMPGIFSLSGRGMDGINFPGFITGLLVRISVLAEKLTIFAESMRSLFFQLNRFILEEYYPVMVACIATILIIHKVLVKRYGEGGERSI